MEIQKERFRVLQNLQAPRITRVGERDADIMWQEVDTSEATSSGGPYPEIDHSEFTYEIFVFEGSNSPICVMQHRVDTSETNHSLNESQNIDGLSTSIPELNGFCLTRLKPATEYLVNIRATILKDQNSKEICMHTSPNAKFRTFPSRPDPPLRPRLVARYSNSIVITWRATLDNGSSIISYSVQISKNKQETFETVFEGMAEQTRINSLENGSYYQIRIFARNEFGTSDPSPLLSILMQPSPPTHLTSQNMTSNILNNGPASSTSTLNSYTSGGSIHLPGPYMPSYHKQILSHSQIIQRPAPPTLLTLTSKCIRLTWNISNEFLEMCDVRLNPLAYNPIPNECYSSSGTLANINGLLREYRFRLAATTVNGEILRSDHVSVKTHRYYDRYDNQNYNNQNNFATYSQTNAQGLNSPFTQPSQSPHEKELLPPTQLHKIFENEESIEIGWRYIRDMDSVIFIVEASSFSTMGQLQDYEQDSTKIPHQKDWHVCYKGTNLTAHIQDSILCLFRVQSNWSNVLYVRRSAAKKYYQQQKLSTQQHKQLTAANTSPQPIKPSNCSVPKFLNTTHNSTKISWKTIADINGKKDSKDFSDVKQQIFYELQRIDKKPVILYSAEFELNNLRPLEHIQVRVRAVVLNTDGCRLEGDWSGIGSTCTLSTVTSAPVNLRIRGSNIFEEDNDELIKCEENHEKVLRPNTLDLEWDSPEELNGSMVLEYIVKSIKYALDEQKINAATTSANMGLERRLGTTTETHFCVEKLIPAQRYRFCVLAVNEAGQSPPSEYLEYLSPSEVPEPVPHFQATPFSTAQIQLTWNKPKSNGSSILDFRILVWKIGSDAKKTIKMDEESKKENTELTDDEDEDSNVDAFEKSTKLLAEYVLEPEETTFLVSDLETETLYEFAIESRNSIGKSLRERISCQTLSPPPEPPVLTLIHSTSNMLKLKWVSFEAKKAPGYFYLEKENENGTFSPVYEGELQTAKVKSLKERTSYNFRIRAAIGRGIMVGAWSKCYSFRTARQPPTALKNSPTVSEVAPGLFQVEWPETRCVNELQQPLQLTNGSMQLVYEGPSNVCTIPIDGSISRAARVLVVQRFTQPEFLLSDDGTNIEMTHKADFDEEESISAPSPIAYFSTTPSESPKKRAKNGSTNAISTRSHNCSGKKCPKCVITPKVEMPVRQTMGRRIRRLFSSIKKVITEKDCALFVIVSFFLSHNHILGIVYYVHNCNRLFSKLDILL